MIEPIVTSQVAIGACLNCRQLFLITPDLETCYLCGRPPAYRLAFPLAPSHAPVGLETPLEELPPAGSPILIGITCPHCHDNVQLSISDSEISVVPPPVPEPEEEEPKGVISREEAIAHLIDLGYTHEAAEKKLDEASAPSEPADDRTTVPSP